MSAVGVAPADLSDVHSLIAKHEALSPLPLPLLMDAMPDLDALRAPSPQEQRPCRIPPSACGPPQADRMCLCQEGASSSCSTSCCAAAGERYTELAAESLPRPRVT
jgi:hypothetical protein